MAEVSCPYCYHRIDGSRLGFLCAERNFREGFDQSSTQWLFENAYADAPILPIFEINPDTRYKLAWLNAPVFNPDRSVAFVMGVQGFSGEYSGAKILSIARHRSAACSVWTRTTSVTSSASIKGSTMRRTMFLKNFGWGIGRDRAAFFTRA